MLCKRLGRMALPGSADDQSSTFLDKTQFCRSEDFPVATTFPDGVK